MILNAKYNHLLRSMRSTTPHLYGLGSKESELGSWDLELVRIISYKR